MGSCCMGLDNTPQTLKFEETILRPLKGEYESCILEILFEEAI